VKRPPIIFLLGPPDAGKTTPGSWACKELGLPFLDLAEADMERLARVVGDTSTDVSEPPWTLQHDRKALAPSQAARVSRCRESHAREPALDAGGGQHPRADRLRVAAARRHGGAASAPRHIGADRRRRAPRGGGSAHGRKPGESRSSAPRRLPGRAPRVTAEPGLDLSTVVEWYLQPCVAHSCAAMDTCRTRAQALHWQPFALTRFSRPQN